MRFINLPENIKKIQNEKLINKSIALYKKGLPILAFKVLIDNLSKKDLIDYYLYILEKSHLNCYKNGIILLKESIQNYYKTPKLNSFKIIAENFSKNLNKFNSAATNIIYAINEEQSHYQLVVLLNAIYNKEFILDDRISFKLAIADLLEYKFNNKLFRLLYVNN